MQTKTYEVVTVPGGPLEDMAEQIEDAYIEANIDGGRVVAVHSIGYDSPQVDGTASPARQQGVFVVVEYPLENSPRHRDTVAAAQ